VRQRAISRISAGTNPARYPVMRDVRLFVLGHFILLAVAVLGSI
jgi:hypothetical protein